jgi:hypothetical protein
LFYDESRRQPAHNGGISRADNPGIF